MSDYQASLPWEIPGMMLPVESGPEQEDEVILDYDTYHYAKEAEFNDEWVLAYKLWLILGIEREIKACMFILEALQRGKAIEAFYRDRRKKADR